MGHSVVAEGVESREVLDQLDLLGCDTAQGYYMARPMPVAELEKWLLGSEWGQNGILILGHYSDKEKSNIA